MSAAPTSDWHEVRRDLVAVAGRIAALLRAESPSSTPVPGLDWTVAELAAHLVSLPVRYGRMLDGPQAYPDSLTDLNEVEIRDVGIGRTLPELADGLEAATADLIERLGGDGARHVRFFTTEHTVVGVGGVFLGELLVHGFDLTSVRGSQWSVTADQARAALRGITPILPFSVDPEVLGDLAGTVHLRIRPDDDWTFALDGDELEVSAGLPDRADVHVSAAPVAQLMVGFGRGSRVRAVATGQIVTYGRRPWRALRFAELFAES